MALASINGSRASAPKLQNADHAEHAAVGVASGRRCARGHQLAAPGIDQHHRTMRSRAVQNTTSPIG